MLLTTIFKYFKEALPKRYLNFGITEKTILELQKLIDNYDVNLNVFFPEFIKYVKRNINLPKQIPPDSPTIINYYKISKKQLLIEFAKQYPALLKEFPDFFLILQTCKYKNEFILNDDYEFITSKLQKTVLSFIDSIYHPKDNEPDFIIALFKPKYKTNQKISNAMTQRISDKYIKDFEAFLKREQKIFNLNRLK